MGLSVQQVEKKERGGEDVKNGLANQSEVMQSSREAVSVVFHNGAVRTDSLQLKAFKAVKASQSCLLACYLHHLCSNSFIFMSTASPFKCIASSLFRICEIILPL